MQPHCARLVVAGRRRDRDDPRALRARAPSSVEADARAMDHRAHVAGPPPLRQPVPEITAAPSVEGSAGKLGCYSEAVKDYFRASVLLDQAAATEGNQGRGKASPMMRLGVGRLSCSILPRSSPMCSASGSLKST